MGTGLTVFSGITEAIDLSGYVPYTGATADIDLGSYNIYAANLNWKQYVEVATTGNINISSPPSSIDSITLTAGQRILVWLQTTQSQNGIYIFNGAGVPLTRASDFNSDAQIRQAVVQIARGSNFAGVTFRNTNFTTITIGSTNIGFQRLVGAGSGLIASTFNNLSIASTGVVSGSYGLSNQITTFTVLSTGQLISASYTPISISYTQVYDFSTGVSTALSPLDLANYGLVYATHQGWCG